MKFVVAQTAHIDCLLVIIQLPSKNISRVRKFPNDSGI